MSDNWIPIVAVLAVFGSTSWVVWVIVEAFRQRARLRVANEFHNKLLDRLSSARDFSDFLNSEGGARLLDSISGGGPKAPQARILRAVHSGIVMVALGAALFLFSWFNPDMWFEAHRVVTFIGTIAFALGIGMIVAAAVSYSLSRRMGLLEQDRSHTTVTPSV